LGRLGGQGSGAAKQRLSLFVTPVTSTLSWPISLSRPEVLIQGAGRLADEHAAR
jgi:hypothetical protein